MSSKTNEQLEYCNNSQEWANKWMILDEDLDYGNQLVEEFKPFMLWLINQGYTKRTIKQHCDNLWLLGAEIINSLNINGDLRDTPAKKLLSDSIDEWGGPISSYLDSESEEERFDATCRKLHKFLSANKAHK